MTTETTVNALIDATWRVWTTPNDIVEWNATTDEWHTSNATIDLQVGGSFSYRIEAKDGSVGFDFTGRFTNVVEHEIIEFVMDDDRAVNVEFIPTENGVTVRETFDAESQNDSKMQRQGWQAILNNFAKHVESDG